MTRESFGETALSLQNAFQIENILHSQKIQLDSHASQESHSLTKTRTIQYACHPLVPGSGKSCEHASVL